MTAPDVLSKLQGANYRGNQMPLRAGEDAKYSPRSPDQIRQVANDLREKLSIAHGHAPDLAIALVRLHSVYPKFRLSVVDDLKLPNAEAKAYRKSWLLKIRQSIFDALSKYGSGRARWTVAHELGHIALDHIAVMDASNGTGGRPRNFFRKPPGGSISSKRKLFEREADIFAREFLMPMHLIPSEMTVSEISTRFQVTLEAARYRKGEVEAARKKNERQDKSSRRAPIGSPGTRSPDDAAKSLTKPPSNLTVIASMPFTLEMNHLYVNHLKPTVERAGLRCQRSDEASTGDSVGDEVRAAIIESALLIAEISTANPDVVYEIGLAQSLGIKTILICREGYEEKIPLSIRHLQRVIYPSVEGGVVLRELLSHALRQVIRSWEKYVHSPGPMSGSIEPTI